MTAANPRAPLHPLTRGMILVAAMLLIAACSRGDASGPLPPQTPTIDVDLIEHDVRYDGPVPAGRVVFRVDNAGEQPHQLSLLSLAKDSPPIQEQLQDTSDQSPVLLAQVQLLGPGETGMFAAGLAGGQRYALVDLSGAPDDDTTHAELGMAVEFQTSDGQQTPTP